ncbi:hypothetical protein PFISCL1PPCAC_25182 [Pristionchus fissidentatus]|uniref:Cytochrome P450 n=1 Tax=Pristionchus fissidentatus TaxID=1538716 RepID=A0AAV5WTJ3_9BILA|nr:hypothetical protein PFISCL1PPCAC_25182 [Pristionchus fissidentatus]
MISDLFSDYLTRTVDLYVFAISMLLIFLLVLLYPMKPKNTSSTLDYHPTPLPGISTIPLHDMIKIVRTPMQAFPERATLFTELIRKPRVIGKIEDIPHIAAGTTLFAPAEMTADECE